MQVTGKRFHNVSGICGKSLEEDVTTYQEHLASYLKKITTYQERLASDLQVGSCCNVSGTSCMLLDEDVTTYQEHHSNYLKKS